MEIKEADKRFELNKLKYSVRTMQAVLQYGVGAMVDFREQTLMTAAPEYWANSVKKIYDERLQKVLNVDYFGMPSSMVDGKPKDGISYARFPEWYFCPKCRKFKPLNDWIKEYKIKGKKNAIEDDPQMIKHMQCPSCRQNLIVARLVTICEHGHIDDFPWVKWVHAKNYSGAKKVCKFPSLELHSGNSSKEGLESLRISCSSCGASASLKDVFGEGKSQGNPFKNLDVNTSGMFDFTCTGRQPWKNSKEICNLYPKAVQRGASSVYFPIVVSSLVIPPYSEKLNIQIENSSEYEAGKNNLQYLKKELKSLLTEEVYKEKQKEIIEDCSKKIAVSLQGVKAEKIKEILNRKWINEESDNDISDFSHYKFEEYSALTGAVTSTTGDSDDFVMEIQNINDYMKSDINQLRCIKRISLIKKIREVQALTGFSRLKPIEKDDFGGISDNIVPIKEPETNWYPAYEVRGEGIFIEFDDNQIKNWYLQVPDVSERAAKLQERYNESYFGSQSKKKITAKYLLLHTISHLLIRELSFNCGYNIASLKERIYCSDASEGMEMSGIFIYTAGGDSEGTLGGLVRQGRPDVFPKIFKKAVKSAQVCSNDPVCNMSTGQGRDSLNLAACYSCTLIPETSCEEFNVFLDRAVVIGTYDNRNLGFFENDYTNDNIEKIKSENTFEEHINSLIIGTDGIDLTDSDYRNIWNSLTKETTTEGKLINSLIENYSLFSSKEKPFSDGSFDILGKSEETFGYNLAWKRSRVMFFSSDYKEEYESAKLSDWTCFFADDDSLTPQIIAQKLENI